MTAALYECTYCAHYSRSTYTGRPTGLPTYTGTRKQVLAHANTHPIGCPADYPRRIK